MARWQRLVLSRGGFQRALVPFTGACGQKHWGADARFIPVDRALPQQLTRTRVSVRCAGGGVAERMSDSCACDPRVGPVEPARCRGVPSPSRFPSCSLSYLLLLSPHSRPLLPFLPPPAPATPLPSSRQFSSCLFFVLFFSLPFFLFPRGQIRSLANSRGDVWGARSGACRAVLGSALDTYISGGARGEGGGGVGGRFCHSIFLGVGVCCKALFLCFLLSIQHTPENSGAPMGAPGGPGPGAVRVRAGPGLDPPGVPPVHYDVRDGGRRGEGAGEKDGGAGTESLQAPEDGASKGGVARPRGP